MFWGQQQWFKCNILFCVCSAGFFLCPILSSPGKVGKDFESQPMPLAEESSSRHPEGSAVTLLEPKNLCFRAKVHHVGAIPWSSFLRTGIMKCGCRNAEYFSIQGFVQLWRISRHHPSCECKMASHYKCFSYSLFPLYRNLIFLNVTLPVHYHPLLCPFCCWNGEKSMWEQGIECESRASVLIITIIYFSAFQQKWRARKLKGTSLLFHWFWNTFYVLTLQTLF